MLYYFFLLCLREQAFLHILLLYSLLLLHLFNSFFLQKLPLRLVQPSTINLLFLPLYLVLFHLMFLQLQLQTILKNLPLLQFVLHMLPLLFQVFLVGQLIQLTPMIVGDFGRYVQITQGRIVAGAVRVKQPTRPAGIALTGKCGTVLVRRLLYAHLYADVGVLFVR